MTHAINAMFLKQSTPTTTLNIERVQSVYRALKARDKKTLGEVLADEPVWDVSPGFPDGAVYTGMAEVFGRFYPKIFSQVHALGAFPERFIDDGDIVVALGHYRVRARPRDANIPVRFAHIWRINNQGRVQGVWQVADSASFPRRV